MYEKMFKGLVIGALSVGTIFSYNAKDIIISTDWIPDVLAYARDLATKITSDFWAKKRDRTIDINVDLPTAVKRSVRIDAYIDGAPNKSEKLVPAYGASYVVSIKGSLGKKIVTIVIEGQKYRVYEVDFDASTNNVRKIEANPFRDSNSSREKHQTENGTQDNNKTEDENQIYANSTISAFTRARNRRN